MAGLMLSISSYSNADAIDIDSKVDNDTYTQPSSTAEEIELKSYESGIAEHININDLDLTSPDGVFELRSRIEIAAKSTCQKLSDLSPLIFYGVAEMRDCNKRTIKSTNKQVKRLIESAKGE